MKRRRRDRASLGGPCDPDPGQGIRSARQRHDHGRGQDPGEAEIQLVAEASDRTPGRVPWRRSRRVAGNLPGGDQGNGAADGSEVGGRATGWAVEPGDRGVFANDREPRALLTRMAQESGGEVLPPDRTGTSS